MTTGIELDGTSRAQRERDRRFHLHANNNPTTFATSGPTMIRRGEGVYVETDDGHRVIDGMSGGWCTARRWERTPCSSVEARALPC